MYKNLGIAALVIAGLIAGSIFKEGIDEPKRIDLMFDLLYDAVEQTGIRFAIFFVISYLGIGPLRAHKVKSRNEKKSSVQTFHFPLQIQFIILKAAQSNRFFLTFCI